MNDINQQLSCIKNNIHACEKRFHKTAGNVMLLAVSKKQPAEKIETAFQAGQAAFGESYVQEAIEKQKQLAHLAIDWHFIGNIQSNKTKLIASHFNWVHSVNRQSIAKRLNDHRPDHLPPLNVFIEVNIDNDPSKSGVPVTDVKLLAQSITTHHPKLNLRGLMVIPHHEKDPNKQFLIFKKVADLQASLISKGIVLDALSMGMSADYEMAIKAGSTLVRIGTALFGEREK